MKESGSGPPNAGPCVSDATPSCSTSDGVTMCIYAEGAADEDIADLLLAKSTDAMWGGKGHTVVHIDMSHKGAHFCI